MSFTDYQCDLCKEFMRPEPAYTLMTGDGELTFCSFDCLEEWVEIESRGGIELHNKREKEIGGKKRVDKK